MKANKERTIVLKTEFQTGATEEHIKNANRFVSHPATGSTLCLWYRHAKERVLRLATVWDPGGQALLGWHTDTGCGTSRNWARTSLTDCWVQSLQDAGSDTQCWGRGAHMCISLVRAPVQKPLDPLNRSYVEIACVDRWV